MTVKPATSFPLVSNSLAKKICPSASQDTIMSIMISYLLENTTHAFYYEVNKVFTAQIVSLCSFPKYVETMKIMIFSWKPNLLENICYKLALDSANIIISLILRRNVMQLAKIKEIIITIVDSKASLFHLLFNRIETR